MAVGSTGVAAALCLLLAAPAFAAPPAGDAEAAYQLGLRADLGQGVPEDAGAAYRWYRRAAEAGLAAAEFNVAVMEDSGRGIARDTADAATWYARAAARGNARAQYDLGLLYEAGDGVPRNPVAARAWFALALTNGLPAAGAKLGAPDLSGVPRAGAGESVPAAVPVAPAAGASVRQAADGSVEFVWRAPGQPRAVRYFLQVVTRQDGGPREIHAAYVDVTAALVHLDPADRACFWRVFTVSPRRYIVTPWAAFSLHGLA